MFGSFWINILICVSISCPHWFQDERQGGHHQLIKCNLSSCPFSCVFMIGASSPFTATVVLHYGSACILHFMKPHLFFKLFIPTVSLKFTLKRGPNEKLHQRRSWIYFADDTGVNIQDLVKLCLLLSTAVGATYSSATLHTSSQCSMSLHTINKSSSGACGSRVKKSDSTWKWAEWAGVRRWGQEWHIYIKRGAESIPALGPLTDT